MRSVKRPVTRIAAVGSSTALIATGIVAFSPISPAFAASTSQTFSYTGAGQTFAVPNGVQALTINAAGAGGGAGGNSGGAGAPGGSVNATVDLQGDTNLSVFVGGFGSGAIGGFNGGGNGGTGYASGGGGGGASDVRLSNAISSRLVTAGGGGGGGAASTEDGGAAGAGGGSTASAGTAGSGNGGGSAGAAAGSSSATGVAGGNGGTVTWPLRNGGGGGGGGGGFVGGGGGGGGAAGSVLHNASGGGGGGGGSAGVVAGATNVSYGTAGIGNGSVTLSWVDITTTGLPDGVVGIAYPSTTLTATGGSGSYAWSLLSGTVPAGLTFDASTATLSGNPTATADETLTFQVTDSVGNITTQSFELDVLAGDTRVTDAPATNITLNTATANGTVYPQGADISSVYCRFSTSADTSAGTQVTASPASVPSTATSENVSCALTGLAPNTTYYYNVYAVQGSTTHVSQSPQSFTTEPKADQTANIKYAKKIKWKGNSVVLPKRTLTSAGKVVKVKVKRVSKPLTRGDNVTTPLYRVIRKNGKVTVRTYGKKNNWYLQVIYTAPGDANTNPFKSVRTYRVHKRG